MRGFRIQRRLNHAVLAEAPVVLDLDPRVTLNSFADKSRELPFHVVGWSATIGRFDSARRKLHTNSYYIYT